MKAPTEIRFGKMNFQSCLLLPAFMIFRLASSFSSSQAESALVLTGEAVSKSPASILYRDDAPCGNNSANRWASGLQASQAQ